MELIWFETVFKSKTVRVMGSVTAQWLPVTGKRPEVVETVVVGGGVGITAPFSRNDESWVNRSEPSSAATYSS